MSRTRKDSRSTKETIIQVTKRDDGTFDLFVNRRLDHGGIEEKWLGNILCERFGYCANEFESILSELNKSGRVERKF